MGSILIVQMAKLGDYIQSTPLLANLRLRFPEHTIELAAENPAVIEAARLSPLVDNIIDLSRDRLDSGRTFDDVFLLNSHKRAALAAQSVKCRRFHGPRLEGETLRPTRAQKFLRAVMAHNRRLGRMNLVDVWLSLLPEAKPLPLVWPKPAAENRLDHHPTLKIAFQLGCRNHLRRWPTESFAQTALALNEIFPALEISLLGGPDERALGKKFESLLAGQFAGLNNLIGRTSLDDLGRVLSGQDLLITADTGVMHLAAAVGLKTLALFFGPAYGPETGPYGPGHIICQALADCAPCRENTCRHKQCLLMPPPQFVSGLAAGLIKNNIDAVGLNIPPGHRLWQTETDGFGQNLRPLGRPALDADEVLALLLNEIGRKILRPNYKPEAGNIDLSAYGRPEAVRGLSISFPAETFKPPLNCGGASPLRGNELTPGISAIHDILSQTFGNTDELAEIEATFKELNDAIGAKLATY